MGLFDSVYFTCPNCHHNDIEVQSKAGDCFMQTFNQDSVPMVIAADISGETVRCEGCKHTFVVKRSEPAPQTIAMELVPEFCTHCGK